MKVPRGPTLQPLHFVGEVKGAQKFQQTGKTALFMQN
jgi:hypothetical protein